MGHESCPLVPPSDGARVFARAVDRSPTGAALQLLLDGWIPPLLPSSPLGVHCQAGCKGWPDQRKTERQQLSERLVLCSWAPMAVSSDAEGGYTSPPFPIKTHNKIIYIYIYIWMYIYMNVFIFICSSSQFWLDIGVIESVLDLQLQFGMRTMLRALDWLQRGPLGSSLCVFVFVCVEIKKVCMRLSDMVQSWLCIKGCYEDSRDRFLLQIWVHNVSQHFRNWAGTKKEHIFEYIILYTI